MPKQLNLDPEQLNKFASRFPVKSAQDATEEQRENAAATKLQAAAAAIARAKCSVPMPK